MRILITGCTGFIGGHLYEVLAADPLLDVRGVTTSSPSLENKNIFFLSKGLNSNTNWSDFLIDVDVVIHLAAIAHSNVDYSLLDEVNHLGTEQLVKAALNAGVKRFIFFSSVGVHGNQSKQALTADSPLAPITDYAKTKLAAENKVRSLLANTNMDYVIIRPPMVYGGDAKGTFNKLLQIVKKGFPLPFKQIQNKKSFIAIDNLVAFVRKVVFYKGTVKDEFLVSDNQDMSTANLIENLQEALLGRSKLFYFPNTLLKLALSIVGKRSMYEQLTNNLYVDSQKAINFFAWEPNKDIKSLLDITRISK